MNIGKIKRKLFDKYPFFGTIIDTIPYVEAISCVDFNGNPTTATDGSSIYYHPEFIKNLSEEECEFVFAHEIVHVAFNHVERGKDKDQIIWNIAADAVTNAFLKKDGFELVKGAVDIPWARFYDVEKMYDKLLKKKKQKKKEKCRDVGHDTHRFWNQEKIKTPEADVIKKVQEKLVELGEKEVLKNKKPEEKKELLEEIKEVLKETTKKDRELSRIPSPIDVVSMETESKSGKFGHVGIHEPLVNWPRILKKPIEISELDWSYQNAYLEDGVLSANLEESFTLQYYETEILLDTSRSISDELLRAFLRECKCIANFSKLKVGCFDTQFYGWKEIKSVQDIDEFIFVGRGGTNFDVAVNSFSKTSSEKIIFTDGGVGGAIRPSGKHDVIWIVFGDEKINPEGGKVIYIDTEKLLHLSRKEKTLEKRWEK